MQIVLLSGGSGKRLWPLSNNTRSKQFLKVLPTDNGFESMVQRTCSQLNKALENYDLNISTSGEQKAILEKQLTDLKNDINIICEPSRRNTFPAVLLSAAYLIFKKNVDLNENVIYAPIDSFTSSAFFDKFNDLEKSINNRKSKYCLLGINPTYPSEKYGYILDENNEISFKEKPNAEVAKALINKGALWNAGVFCTKLKSLKSLLDNYRNFTSYEEVYDYFEKFDKKSFDYMVLEKEKSLSVINYSGEWKDLGTWNTLAEEINDSNGRVIMGEGCKNTTVINELHTPIITLGLKNVVVAASPDGILVSDKLASVNLNNYVNQLPDRIKYEERNWGRYIVLDETEKKLVKTLYIDANKNLSYQKHAYRDEVWTIVSGKGKFVLDGEIKDVKENDVLFIPRESKHSIKAIVNLEILEVQLGENFIEEDIERFDFDWNANITRKRN